MYPPQYRVFGPNLSREGQAKAQFHVHAEGCGDTHHYGPGTRYGGDDPDGWLLPANSLDEIVQDVYPPEDFDYDPETGIDPYRDDFYVAPCCKGSHKLS